MATRSSYLVRLLLAVAFCLVGVAAAQAQEWTFQVPVQLKSIQANVTAVHVFCTVYDKNRQPISGISAPNQTSLDATGNFNQTLTAKVSVAPGKDPSLGATYECDLVFDGVPGTSGCYPGVQPECPIKSGSYKVSGNIPQQ